MAVVFQQLIKSYKLKAVYSCRVNQYSVGHYEVLGYGVPQY